VPRTKAEIIDLLQQSGDAFASFLEGLSESTLSGQLQAPAA
jgi:hypothetical protein